MSGNVWYEPGEGLLPLGWYASSADDTKRFGPFGSQLEARRSIGLGEAPSYRGPRCERSYANPDASKLAPAARAIFDRVFDAMQEAEELGGPDGDDYVALMRAIAREASARVTDAERSDPR